MDPLHEFMFRVQSPQLTGGVKASSAVDEAYINGVYAGLKLRSLLTHGSLDTVADAHNLLSMPITEQLFPPSEAVLHAEAPPFNFFPEPATFSHHHIEELPNLLSLETATGPESHFPTSRRFSNVLRTPPSMPRRRQLQRGDRVSEKTRRLQNLLPSDEKMDTAKVLEETYKYIKFLEAQVSVLQSMPGDDCESGENWSTTAENGGADLGRLNRPQLLQVLVNSPAAQTKLYSNGCCVYSVEQLDLLKNIAEGNALFHRRPYDYNPNL